MKPIIFYPKELWLMLKIIFNPDYIKKLKSKPPLIKQMKQTTKLNFGCGNKILEGFVNVDIEKYADKSFNFEKYPYPFKDDTFEYILVDNVLEHMLYPLKVMEELHRISKSKTIIKIRVPYYNSGGAYNDVTHHHYFNKRTFFRMEEQLKGKFKIIELKLRPTRLGRFIPKFIRERLCFLIGTIIGGITVEIEVNKKTINQNPPPNKRGKTNEIRRRN